MPPKKGRQKKQTTNLFVNPELMNETITLPVQDETAENEVENNETESEVMVIPEQIQFNAYDNDDDDFVIKIPKKDVMRMNQMIVPLMIKESKQTENTIPTNAETVKDRIHSNKNWNVNGLVNSLKSCTTNLENDKLMDITWKQTITKNLLTINKIMLYLITEE